MDPDPIDQIDPSAGGLLDKRPHDRPLLLPGGDDGFDSDMNAGELVDDVGQRAVCSGERSSNDTKVAVASNDGMKAERCGVRTIPGERHVCLDRRRHDRRGRSRGERHRAPIDSVMAHVPVRDRHCNRSSRKALAPQHQLGKEELIEVKTRPVSSITVSCSPPGVKTTPSDASDARTSARTRSACASRSNAVAPTVDAYGFTAITSAPSFANRLGMMNDTAP